MVRRYVRDTNLFRDDLAAKVGPGAAHGGATGRYLWNQSEEQQLPAWASLAGDGRASWDRYKVSVLMKSQRNGLIRRGYQEYPSEVQGSIVELLV